MTNGAIVLLALTVFFWLILVAVLRPVVGQHASGDAAMGQAITWIYACMLVVLTWICLSALLMVAGSHDLLPAWAGVLAVLLVPASGAATFGAIYLLDTTPARWPYALPMVIPGLLAAYVLALYQPWLRPAVAGWAISPAVGGIVAALSIAAWPAVSYRMGEPGRKEAARKISLADPIQRHKDAKQIVSPALRPRTVPQRQQLSHRSIRS